MIEKDGSKSCITLIDPKFLVTYRHGFHLEFVVGTELEIFSVTDDQKFNVHVAYIEKELDFILLRSSVKLKDRGPGTVSARWEQEVLVCGFGDYLSEEPWLTGKTFHQGFGHYHKGKHFKHLFIV